MSSERFEYAEDELEGVLERLGSALTQLGNKSLNNVKKNRCTKFQQFENKEEGE